MGSVSVPDSRLARLRDMYTPKKYTPAKVDYIDVPAVEQPRGGERGGLSSLSALRDVDAFVLVIRAFEDPSVPHFMTTVDPARDASWLAGELLLEDLAIVEKRLEKIEKALKVGKKPEDPQEYEALRRIREVLESERPARDADLTLTQERAIRGFQFFTLRPWIVVVNVDEGAVKDSEGVVAAVRAKFPEPRPTVVALSAKIEAELAALPETEAQEFMAMLGIEEPGLTRMIRLSYEVLGLVSFFTVGPDEVRAWTIRRETAAPEAAGAIHSDLERGFIRAEVIAYDDLIGSETMAKARERGLLRTEGRDYRVRDGDIVNIRFSV